MRNDTVVRFRKKDELVDPLTELLREGAQRLISQAMGAELELFLEHHGGRRDGEGRRAVVRNGYLPSREGLTGGWASEERSRRSSPRRAISAAGCIRR